MQGKYPCGSNSCWPNPPSVEQIAEGIIKLNRFILTYLYFETALYMAAELSKGCKSIYKVRGKKNITLKSIKNVHGLVRHAHKFTHVGLKPSFCTSYKNIFQIKQLYKYTKHFIQYTVDACMAVNIESEQWMQIEKLESSGRSGINGQRDILYKR